MSGRLEAKGPSIYEQEVPFACSICEFSETAHYLGVSPDHLKKSISFSCPTYILARDPFASNPDKRSFLILGGHCSTCQRTICRDCSLFYDETFACHSCAAAQITSYPSHLHDKIRKLT